MVYDDGSAAVFETVDAGVHFTGFGFWSGAFLGILTVDFSATGFALFVGEAVVRELILHF